MKKKLEKVNIFHVCAMRCEEKILRIMDPIKYLMIFMTEKFMNHLMIRLVKFEREKKKKRFKIMHIY